MGTDDSLHRLQQAWRYASVEARRDFLREILHWQGLHGEREIQMTSQVNSADGSPAVLLQWGEQVLQMDSDTAKRHGLAVVETALAADADSFLFAFVRDAVGAPPEKAAMILMDFRTWREAEARRRAVGVGAREHPAPYLRTEPIAAHASCE